MEDGRPEAHVAAGEVVERLLALTGELHRLLAECAARADLTPQQAMLLRCLGQRRPMHTVAAELSCDPSNVTGLIDRLERRGLVERGPDAADRRVRVLSLTAAGRRVRAELERDLARAAALPAGLSPAELRQLLGLLAKFRPGGAEPR